MKVTNSNTDLEHINLNVTSELTRDEALVLWRKVFLESDIEDYLEHYPKEKKLPLYYARVETNYPRLAKALSDVNDIPVEGIIILGNEALRNIKIGDYRRPKKGHITFSDNSRLKGLALLIQTEEETKRADAKAAAIAKRANKETPTVEEVLEMEDYVGEDEIVNYIVLKKVINDTPQNFYIETRLVNGEIEMALTPSRAIPTQTAPNLDFIEVKYTSFNAIYDSLRKEITDYIAFPTDSIAPDLIALGSVASYFREVFYTFPYFDYISSEPEAGKTTAMKVQTFLSFYGTIASSVTEALLFREIDGSHCFYGLDNIERLFASPKDYSSIIDWLLSSYSRDIPCKRLEKTEEGYEVRYFDGYGIKAFTHIRDFPFALRALRSRCIQIVMQSGKPQKFYPSAEKFTGIRDKLYRARLYEFEAVKKSYESLINSNALSGRTGDLYYPLLAIAKLVDNKLFQRVLNYATTEEVERKELDSWNMMLIKVLLDNELLGSRSTNEIRGVYEEALISEGLLKDATLATRTVTIRLKKLGFQREEKKTENKTWFLISREQLMSKAQEYNILEVDELKKYVTAHTPPNPNFPNLSNFGEGENKPKEGSTEGGGEDKPGIEEIDLDRNGSNEELTKVGKLAKKGVCENTKNVCDRCGKNAICSLCEGQWICEECMSRIEPVRAISHDNDVPVVAMGANTK